MSNQTVEPNNNTQRFNLTTKSLGIADVNTKDLGGFEINQSDISTAVMKILLSVGIPNEAIRSIKVGCDAERKLKIFVELRKRLLSKKKKVENDWYSFDECDEEDDDKIFSKEFFNTLKNKVFYKHLKYKIIERRKEKNGRKKDDVEKFVELELDSEILIAFVYNLDYCDEYYRVSCSPVEFLSNGQLKKKYDSTKKRDEYKRNKNELLSKRLMNCTIVVTYRIDKLREISMYNSIIDKIVDSISVPIADKNALKLEIKSKFTRDDFMAEFNNTLSSADFHPNQVAEFYADIKRNKKHKK